MNTDLKTAAAYIRVSTDRQTELSPESQLAEIQRFAKENGYIIPKEYVFRDDGISGRHADKRPEFQKMIALSKNKPSPFCAILVWKYSRFSRNQEEAIVYKSMLKKNEIAVVSISEQMDDSPYGSLIERIIEWMDEYYSIRLSGEVKRGMTERVERGGAVSVPAFGYNIDNKEYVINHVTAPIVKKIFADYLNGEAMRRIAQNLNDLKIKTARGSLWENRTIEYILRNPVYIGKIRWNPKRKTRRNYDDPDIMIVDGRHEAIISEEIFNKVQELLDINKMKHLSHIRSAVNEEYMLHGLLKCSNCGATLTMAVKSTSLQCINYVHGKCKVSHSITIKKANEMVINSIEQTFKTGKFKLDVKNINKNITEKSEININALIQKEEHKLRRIKEAFEDGAYTLDEYKESKELIGTQIKKLKKHTVKPQNIEKELRKKLIEKYKNISVQLRNCNLSEAEKNDILRSFIDKIVFNRANTSIELFFYI